MFGCGVYLAEDPSKIDQYCTPDTGGPENLEELWKALSPPHPGAGIAIEGDVWVSGWYPAATELKF